MPNQTTAKVPVKLSVKNLLCRSQGLNLEAEAWSWTGVIVVGRGLDNNLYAFAYDMATGGWVRCKPFAGGSRV
jgi:hypothetical protein